MNKLAYLIAALCFLGVGCSNEQQRIIAEQQKRIDELTQLQTTSSQQIQKDVSPVAPTSLSQLAKNAGVKLNTTTVKNSLPPKEIAEKNFYDDTIKLYLNKVTFLEKQIKIFDIYKGIFEDQAADERDSISVAEKLQNQGVNTSFGKAVWQAELAEDVRLIGAYNNATEQLKLTLQKLLDEIKPAGFIGSNVSKAEYLLREEALNTSINEDTIKSIPDAISKTRYFTAQKRDILHAEVLAAAEKDLATLQQQLAAIQAEIARTPPIVLPSINTSQSALPTSIHCETTHNANGYPSTSCTNMTTLQTMRCDTSYNAYGNEQKSCYSR